jgi:long-chain fatty acid transport protein
MSVELGKGDFPVFRFVIQISFGLFLAGYSMAALASGFALREWSGAGQGNAFAGGTAGAEDLSYIAHNPAGLTRHKGEQARFTLTYIAPQVEFSADSATTILGAPIGGGDGGSDSGPNSVAPALYLSHQFSDKLFGGISLAVPFGLSTEYDENWVGRYHAVKTNIMGVELNPVLAYKITPKLSVAGGVRILYAQGELSNAVDFGTLDALNGGFFGGTPTMDDGLAEVEGTDFGFGFNLGILYEIDKGTRVGASYRSKISTNLEGRAHFDNGAVGNALADFTGAFRTTGVGARIDFPETASMGFYHEFTPKWAIMGEAAWTRWSRNKELRVKFDNPFQPDDVLPTDWENSWFFAIGATYKHSKRLTARFGVAYDQSPVPESTRTPRIPDEDRTWLSVGIQYALGKNSALDIGYTHLFLPDPKINLSVSEPANALRGNLVGSHEVSADIIAVQLRITL